MYIIQDWAGDIKFDGETWDSFEKAEEFLSEMLGDNYDTDRQEYSINYYNE